MAPLNGIQAGNQNVRRRMIQPVLPALPFSIKPKQEKRNAEGENKQSNEETQQVQSSTVETNGSNKVRYETSHLDSNSNNEVTELSVNESPVDKSTIDTTLASESFQTASQLEAFITEANSSVVDSDHAEHEDKSNKLLVDVDQSPNIGDDNESPEQEANLGTEDMFTQVHQPVDEPRQHCHEDALGEVSPVSSPSAANIPIELSAQPTPTISTATAISPEVSAINRPPRGLGGIDNNVPEVLTNGHGPQRSLPDLSYPQAGLTTPTRTAHFPNILEHLIHLSNSKNWADWVLEINQPVAHMQPYIAYAHALLLMRSDRLRKMMAQPQDNPYPPNILHFFPARIIQPHAFEAALRCLYSDTVLSADALFTRNSYVDKHAKVQMVDYLLSYWISGIELAIEPVTSRAFNLLAGLTDWEIAELLVNEAYSIRSLSPATHENGTLPESIAMADSIMRLVFGLFARHLDLMQFKLHTDAQTTTMAGRFSNIDFGRSSSNPALAGMVFGSMPSPGTQSPMTPTGSSPSDHVASIILINLDFTDLSILCKDMLTYHGGAGLRLIQEAIDEREKRRLAIIGNRVISNRQRMAKSAVWETLAYREFIEDGQLDRTHVGYLLPNHKR